MILKGLLLFLLVVAGLQVAVCDYPEDCQKPLEVGMCRGYFLKFGFKDGKCQQFVYGGCGGNENNFNTEDECKAACATVTVPVCEQPLEAGPCRAAMPRYGYKNGKCVMFTYGGCRGNGNNFKTEDECISTCATVSACEQPLATGPCRGAMPRFGYKNGKCVKFTYGGCGGNKNNFKTKKKCQKACRGNNTKYGK